MVRESEQEGAARRAECVSSPRGPRGGKGHARGDALTVQSRGCGSAGRAEIAVHLYNVQETERAGGPFLMGSKTDTQRRGLDGGAAAATDDFDFM